MPCQCVRADGLEEPDVSQVLKERNLITTFAPQQSNADQMLTFVVLQAINYPPPTSSVAVLPCVLRRRNDPPLL
jgi:hypothetical protein